MAERRTFIANNKGTRRYWNVELKGKTVSVHFGPVTLYGAVYEGGRRSTKAFDSKANARADFDKRIRQQLRKGYFETTPKPSPPLQRAIEDALAENPDDLASHMAYADLLIEQNDPRGEFIRTQLALEELGPRSKGRAELVKREEELLGQHLWTWLGQLAVFIIDRGYFWTPEGYRYYKFRRGWLDVLSLAYLDADMVQAVLDAPQVRLLRTLRLLQNENEEVGEKPTLRLFRRAELPNLETLDIDGMFVDEDEMAALCSAQFPRLRRLRLASNGNRDLGALARTGLLRRLEILEFEHTGIDDEELRPIITEDLGHLTGLLLRESDISTECREAVEATDVPLLKKSQIHPQ